jgi:nitrogen fixation protein
MVDRKQVPYGGNKPLQLIAHMAQCNGWEFHYQPFVSDYRIPLTVKASQVTTSV